MNCGGEKHICCDRDYLSTYCNNNLQDRSGILDIFLINLSHCDVRGLKNVFFMPFTPPLFQKYPSTMRAACAISEIYSTMRALCYIRNNHPLWEWLALFQKYPPSIMRWAAARGGIGDSSSCMKIDFFLCKIRFRTHRIIIWDKKNAPKKIFTKSWP